MDEGHGVDEDQVGDAVRDAVGGRGDDHAGVAVSDEDDVGEVVVEDGGGDVLDVGAQVDVGAEQVRRVAVAGQGRGQDAVAVGPEQWDDPLPGLAVVPRPVHEDEGAGSGFDGRCHGPNARRP
ncbi:hypothetical protein GCM10009836_25480 [Pseudonocardia ailaonensis]|uniref:Uncharacterized protein n=1 Tax=Pseudonocardia ailaonensis TaxID=367279 RepID=A0ABN2MZH3_9PSEU